VTFVAERDAAAPSTGAAVDPDLVLVEPFSVYDGRLLLWREGLVDVLARDFDRAGPLRTVTPAVAIRHADETGVASAADLGRRLGAGLVVSGTVLAVGPDSVRLTASLTDLTGTRELGDVDIRGPSNRMGQLTDSLALSLLREMEQVRAITAARAVSLRATSLPALKAFLQGEQFYRHSSFDSAITWYERALGQDSTLALAYYRLANAMGWARPGTEDLQETYSLRAGALTRGLAPADSLLLTAHALEPGADPDLARDAPPGPGRQLEERSADAWEAAARLFATLDVAIRRYPGNPDIWYHLGEARVHFGPQFGVPHAAAMSAFDRAIAVDSSFAPAWEHTTDVAPLPDGIAVSRRYAERYLAHHPQTGSASTLEAFLALSAEGVTSDSVARVLARLPADAREGLIFLYKRSPDTTEIAVRLARSALAQDPAATHPATHRLGVRILSYRGHLREALENSRPPDARLLSLTARLHLTPADSAAARFSAWLDRGASEAAYGLPWWAEVGDTAALETFARRENARALKATRPRTSEVHRYWAAVGLGYLALATGDSAEALRRFGGLPRDICPACLEERLILARLLSAAERPREAAAILGERPLWIDLAPAPVEVFWELEEGRVAERLGERERAARCYRFVTEAWRHADPELQSSVRESQAALGRLAQPSPG
jgi:serine/threonine-protein kinase